MILRFLGRLHFEVLEPVLERGLVAFTAALGACTAGAKWEALLGHMHAVG